MAAEIKVPSLGESVTEATVAKWLKHQGEPVAVDEPIAELETDKITLEVYAPAAGTLAEILAEEGANVPVGAVLARIAEGATANLATAPHPAPTLTLPRDAGEGREGARGEREGPAPLGARVRAPAGGRISDAPGEGEGQHALERAGPAVRKLIEEAGLDTGKIVPTGPGGRITKADVLTARAPAPPPPPSAPAGEREVRVRMTRLRRRIAERLK